MCHNCYLKPVSRRRFLQGAAAGLALLLAGCGGSQPEADGTFRVATAVPPAYNRPTLGGNIVAWEQEALVVATPLAPYRLPSAARLRLIDAAGQPLKQRPQPPTPVAVWLEDGMATAVQTLPPLSATDEIPGGLPQPEPTGEQRSFGPLSLVTRAGWGAAEPHWMPGGESGLFDPEQNPAGWLAYPEPLSDWLTTAVIHHAALDFNIGPRPIQRLHVLENRFADVGYHFFVDGVGQVYEGRPLGVRGAHTGGFNTGTVGVCLLGNFSLAPPLQRQLDTLKTLLDALRDLYSVTHVAAHRDFQPGVTACPGDLLRPLLPDLALNLGLTYGTDGYIPPPWA